MKRVGFVLVLVLLIGGAAWKFLAPRGSHAPIVETASSTPPADAQTPRVAPPTGSVPVSEGGARRAPLPEKSILENAPSVEELRNEVAENPHVPPRALIRFAAGIAPRMEAATRSPAEAEKLFGELRECVDSPKTAGSRTLRALCLANIRRLGKKVPALRARAEIEFERADPNLARFAD